MGNINAGIPFPWKKQFEPYDITYYIYSVATVMLAHFFVFRRYYYARPRYKIFLAIFLLLLFFVLFRYLLEEVLVASMIGYGNYNPVTTIRYYIFDNFYFGLIEIFIGFVFFLFDEMFRNRKRQMALKEETRQAELNFLQAQTNPHFLFNSLNNIYSLASDQHPETASAIMKLSDMMRYVTYQREKTVTIAEELSYVTNLLYIQELRHEYPLQTRFDISDFAASVRIPPLLLIPMIENALKHGDLSNPEFPLLLRTSAENKRLTIEITNRKASAHLPAKGGVGLQNLKRRLHLLYRPEQFEFDIRETKDLFIISLSIPVES